MKKIAPILGLLCASSVFAQTSKFEGTYLQASTGYESNTITNTSFLDSNYPTNTANYFAGTNAKSSGLPLVLGAGFYGAINSKFLLGVGFDYSAKKMKNADFTVMNYSNPTPVNMKYEVSNRKSYYLSPAMLLDNSSIAYAKFGFSQQEIQLSAANLKPNSITQQGRIFGVGYKRIYSQNLYGFAEANMFSYSQTASDYFNPVTSDIVQFNPGANSRNLLVGLGYKF